VNFDLNPHRADHLWRRAGRASVNLVQLAVDQIAVQRYLTGGEPEGGAKGPLVETGVHHAGAADLCHDGLVLFAFYHVKGDPLHCGAHKKDGPDLPYFVATELPLGIPGL